MPAAVVAEHLMKTFGEGEARTVAVRDASLEVDFGEMVYIVGPSGSGKTTLLSIISGILRPDGGKVIVEGVDVWALEPEANARFRLNKVGFVFQDYHLFPHLTTAENVAIPLILRGVAWKEALGRAIEQLKIVGLANRAELPPVKLSGGEQQRVAESKAEHAPGPDLA